ncbi:MAG: metallophosphoesterase [Actinomycetota bacterium]
MSSPPRGPRCCRLPEFVRIGVISDTHIPSRAKALPAEVLALFAGVDLILHAGDVSTSGPLKVLGGVAPVLGVAGNIDEADLRAVLPQQLRVTLGGVALGMVHDSGAASGRRERMRRLFPGCRVVIFGHSHQPLCEDRAGLLLLNPGSACDPRRAKIPTVALLEISAGEPAARLVQLGGSAR